MDDSASEQRRESEFLSQTLDRIARLVVEVDDPWDAYRAAITVPAALGESWPDLPHGGGVYVAWAELTDLYAAGKTPIPDAHAALKEAASTWLTRPGPPSMAFIEGWLTATTDRVKSIITTHGDWWTPPA